MGAAARSRGELGGGLPFEWEVPVRGTLCSRISSAPLSLRWPGMNTGWLPPHVTCLLEARGCTSPLPASSSCPVSTSVAESIEAEVAVALVPGEVEELKVTVGLRGEGQIQVDVAIRAHSGPRALVLPVHPEPVVEEGDTTAGGSAASQKGVEGDTLA